MLAESYKARILVRTTVALGACVSVVVDWVVVVARSVIMLVVVSGTWTVFVTVVGLMIIASVVSGTVTSGLRGAVSMGIQNLVYVCTTVALKYE